MSLKLMYITNKPEIAKIAESSGVDWIFVDLEVNGKEERQAGLDTVKSKHNISDIPKIKKVLTTSKLLVRVNPIYEGSKVEINQVIEAGAELVMLPFFKTVEEVEQFIQIVDERAEVMLLLETPEAVDVLDDILILDGIDYIHIGLNDLHLGYNMSFMFELLADGTVENIGNRILEKNIPFGFGGIAQIGEGDLPAERILVEHYRLNSSMVILSRSFCNVDKVSNLKELETAFNDGVSDIRDFEKTLNEKDKEYYIHNQQETIEIINDLSNMDY